jgi:dipeptidyl aminopeptidase/acylaminoacyl peptidase
MRGRLIAVILLVCLGFGATARAEVVNVDPSQEPSMTLEPAEVGKIAALQGAVFPNLVSDISPDDKTILTFISRPGVSRISFVNIQDGSSTLVSDRVNRFPVSSEVRWRDDHTAVFVSQRRQTPPMLVSLNRDTGAVMTSTLHLPPRTFPVSLAPNASRLLLAGLPDQRDEDFSGVSPFDFEFRYTFTDRFGPATFDADLRPLQLARAVVALFSLDLNSGELLYLLSLPQGSGPLGAPAWTQDGSKVALVRATLPTGSLLSEKATQDALGNLPPTDNPFFEDNFVDILDLGKHDFRLAAIKATDSNGDMFRALSWSTDGQTLMAQVAHPAMLTGRHYPTYLFPDRSSIRFYSPSGQQIGSFSRPEIEAPSTATATFVSPDEVIFNAPYGLSYRIYYYNRRSGEFRQVSIMDGTYYQVRSTRLSRQLVFIYSSFKQPYEAFRIGWDGQALYQLTFHNAEITALNQVRADQVSFTLKKGVQRTGYIIQPAGASFPPRNMRMIVWQQGGPGLTMTNEWGANVEQPFNLLPNFGLAVLVVPLPGREGYGPAFYDGLANDRNFGAVDIDEAAQIVQQMITRGYTARGSVGITGCSYGGYFTSQSITRYPDLYAAANTQCTLLDLFHEWQLGFTSRISYLEGRVPTVDSNEYAKDSPAYNATKVRTPVLIFDGVYDFLPVTISGNFHDQVAANRTPVKFIKFDNEGHGLRSVNSQLVASQAQIAWFRQYLISPGGR